MGKRGKGWGPGSTPETIGDGGTECGGIISSGGTTGFEVVGYEVVGWEVVGWEVVEQREAVEWDVPDQSSTKN